MATMDDKLMGEKLHYYCSSSEDEDEKGGPEPPEGRPQAGMPDPNQPNTGPKGVVADWRRYKQLETEKRAENERERLALAKKLALTCRSEREDKEAQGELDNLEDKLDEDDDEFLKEYMKKRMQEMIESAVINKKHFGHVFTLKNGEDFLDAVDDLEHRQVQMVIHLFEPNHPGCQAIDGCLQTIAKEYSHVKFCRIQASNAGLSRNFKASGVPALLVYRSGELVANFVRLTDTLGDDFYASDLEGFLIENGVLSDGKLVPSIIRGPAVQNDDSDSD